MLPLSSILSKNLVARKTVIIRWNTLESERKTRLEVSFRTSFKLGIGFGLGLLIPYIIMTAIIFAVVVITLRQTIPWLP